MKSKVLIGAVLFGVFAFGGANPSPSQKKDEPPKKAKDGDDLAKLGKARVAWAEKAYKGLFERSADVIEARYQYSIRWLNAELDVATKKDERLMAYDSHLQRMKEWQKRNPADAVGDVTIAQLESFRSEAEYWLVRERTANK